MLIYQNETITYAPQFYDLDAHGEPFETKRGFNQVFATHHLFYKDDRIRTAAIIGPVSLGKQLELLFRAEPSCQIEDPAWLLSLTPVIKKEFQNLASLLLISKKKLYLVDLSIVLRANRWMYMAAISECTHDHTVHLGSLQTIEVYSQLGRVMGSEAITTVPAMALMSYVAIKANAIPPHLIEYRDQRRHTVPLMDLDRSSRIISFQTETKPPLQAWN